MSQDIWQQGFADGWRHARGAELPDDWPESWDVCVIGTGAGGAIAAADLAKAGWKVLMVEHGPLRTAPDFNLHEKDVYPQMYQNAGTRKTLDQGITILQGRSVGGSTTVNWTSSFRTPKKTLAVWRSEYGIDWADEVELVPWFRQAERDFSVIPWRVPPNPNNAALARGCEALNIPYAVIPRNVQGCWNLGYCGMGCPTNAKQSTLVTKIPEALTHGAYLLSETYAAKLIGRGSRIEALECRPADPFGHLKADGGCRIRALFFISGAGAIGSPGLFLRSGLADPYERLGQRTFLHPTLMHGAVMPDKVEAYAGAPQSIYSDAFVDEYDHRERVGYKLEVPPVHPVIMSAMIPGFGESHRQIMTRFPYLHVQIALLRDGFHPAAPGGRVVLGEGGQPVLDYEFGPALQEAARRAIETMGAIQWAAGAKAVLPLHGLADLHTSEPAWRQQLERLDYAPPYLRVVSAHVMGGCQMGEDQKQAVADLDGRFHQLDNLYVMDGSLFPTAVGTNPQLTIFAVVSRLTQRFMERHG